MPQVAYFAHDIADAAIARRAQALRSAGISVAMLAMRRSATPPPSDVIDLGRTHDARFAHRLAALGAALPTALRQRARLAQADLWIARNLDMTLLAAAVRAAIGSRAPLLYECLDVHRLMTHGGMVGTALRNLEKAVIDASAGIIVSSPGFVREYFAPRFDAAAKTILIENRLGAGLALPPRPLPTATRPDRPLTIGWFGNLRCRRSLALMRAVARLPNVAVRLCGYPALTEIPDFDAQVQAEPGLVYGGRYAYPNDLAAIYGAVDLVWAGDFHDAGANSRWLLPNRLYEGGYFGVPPIAPAESETGLWLKAHGLGFTLPEPLETTLPDFIRSIALDSVAAARATMLAAPDGLFRQPDDEMGALVRRILRPAQSPLPAAA